MIWFTADTHFCHLNIIEHCRRPFGGIEEMAEAMVSNWNSLVGKGDSVYHLGDFAITWGKNRCSDAISILSRLKGQKFLLKGNHDRKEIYSSPLWAHVMDYKELSLGGRHVILSHYPFRSLRGMHRGSWMLHGHSHGNLADIGGKILDVGVDNHGYSPISFDQVAAWMQNREFRRVDHYGSDEVP